jgi:two-component system OmpR family sensor kinase
MTRLPVSIRWKITLLYAVLLGTLLFGACIIIVTATRQFLLANLDATAQAGVILATLDRQLRFVIIPCLIAALILTLAIGMWLAGRLLQPIAQITETAARIGAGSDLSQRIGAVAPVPSDEVGRLATTFDAMLARLEHAFTAQEQFVADASHELKTPLTAILGQANLLRRHARQNPRLVAEATEAIIEEAERMQGLIQDLLTLARADAAQPHLTTPVVPNQIAQAVVHDLAIRAQEQAITLVFHVSELPAWYVLGDANQLRHMVLNLVDNALKFTPANGRVDVTIAHETAAAPPLVVLTVADTGCGIAPSDVPHLFERFYRADKSRTRAVGGNGLGLAIVHDIVRQHGGDVTVESVLSMGTTVRVHLPALPAMPEASA